MLYYNKLYPNIFDSRRDAVKFIESHGYDILQEEPGVIIVMDRLMNRLGIPYLREGEE